MNRRLLSGLFLFTATAATNLHAAGYSNAEVTRLHNEVRVLKAEKAPRAAVVGDNIDSVTSVATGAQSRAELRFPDQSLTRIGANSQFTLRGDQRTLDLDKGVMLLQVPKKMGGAKVRTAAVTAAVTGTTVLFEYLPGGFIKLIVIEGSVDLYFNDKPSKFITVTAGQMVIMPADAKSFPLPVDIDLKRLLETSRLIAGDDFGTPNHKEVSQAVAQQTKELKKGNLLQTNLVIPGPGTVAQLHSDLNIPNTNVVVQPTNNPNTPNNPSNPQNPSNPTTPNNPGPTVGGVARIGGLTTIDSSTVIYTNPHLDLYNAETESYTTYQGYRYLPNQSVDAFTFDSDRPVTSQAYVDLLGGLPNWALFAFDELAVGGSPFFDLTTGQQPSSGVIFASQGNITLGNNSYNENDLDLVGTGITDVVFHSHNGNILLNPNFFIYGNGFTFGPSEEAILSDAQNLALVATGSNSDISLFGGIFIDPSSGEDGLYAGGELVISAGRNVLIEGNSVTEIDEGVNVYPQDNREIRARSIDIQSGNDITVTKASLGSNEKIKLQAVRNINISSSSELYVYQSVADSTTGRIDITSQNGHVKIGDPNGAVSMYTFSEYSDSEINIQGSSIDLENVYANTDKFRAMAQNGDLRIGGTHLTAYQSIELHANSNVIFFTDSSLQSPQINISAPGKVEIIQGVEVDISNTTSGPANLNVNTPNKQYQYYNGNAGDLTKGKFTGNYIHNGEPPIINN